MGKTTFSATAPGEKLWLSFGDNEHAPVMHRKDVHVAHLAGYSPHDLFNEGGNSDPFGLDKLLAGNAQIETVVVDSVTAIAAKGLTKAIEDGVGKSANFTPTVQNPGISAYGGRNANTLSVINGILRVTAKHNVHVIFTAHEKEPTMGPTGVILYITMNLGGQLVPEMSYRLSEIWFLGDSVNVKDTYKYIAIRASSSRKPMKTRMFNDRAAPSFRLKYDPYLPDESKGQMTIAGWYEQWHRSGFMRLELPK